MKLKKKLTDHDHDKYNATAKFNNLIAKSVAVRLAQINLANKSDIA